MRTNLIEFLVVLLTLNLFNLHVEAADQISFSREIRPILADRCFACHGPDAKSREADLRLDLRQSALSVITPGNSQTSPFIERVTSSDPDTQMPPAEYGKPLKQEQIQLLKQWIKQGANWEEHWSLRPIRRPEVPKANNKKQTDNPIDAFNTALRRRATKR